MLLLLRDATYLGHFRFGYFKTKRTADTLSFRVHLKHNASCLTPDHTKYRFQHFDDEFHGRVIIIDKNNLVQRRSFNLGFSFPLFI